MKKTQIIMIWFLPLIITRGAFLDLGMAKISPNKPTLRVLFKAMV